MLRLSHLQGNRDAPVDAIFAWRTVRTMLHLLLDAFCEGLAAHRKYERLVSMGILHDPALRAALSQTSHCREACACDRRREQKTRVRVDQRLRHDNGLTRVGFSHRSG